MIWGHLILVSIWALFTNGLELPEYIKACHRSDNDLAACGLARAREALPFIVKGDKSLNLPSFSPYHLPEIAIENGNLKIKFVDSVLNGLENVVMGKLEVDPEKFHIALEGTLDRVNLVATYDINGNILVLPISGHGPANITLVGIEFKYVINFDLEQRADEKKYLKIKDNDLQFNVTRGYYQFDNLFQGNAQLGIEMNKFMNENHQEVGKEFNPTFVEIIRTILNRIMEVFITKVEFDKIFPK